MNITKLLFQVMQVILTIMYKLKRFYFKPQVFAIL
jgi:hypothetical protein